MPAVSAELLRSLRTGQCGMFNWLKQAIAALTAKEYNADVLRLAQTEYRKDWEHAYHMLMQGKKPYTGV